RCRDGGVSGMRRWVIVGLITAVVLVPVGIVVVSVGHLNQLHAVFGDDDDGAESIESGCLPAAVVPDETHGDYSDVQLASVATVIDFDRDNEVPPVGWVVAVATAIQESGLCNIDYGVRDSLGLLEKRLSQGWGNNSDITHTGYAAREFYEHLTDVS